MALPFEWRSKFLDDLVRLGNAHDGGYVIPRRTVPGTSVLLSLGISDDWTFEADFVRANPGVRVIGYDPTITGSFWLRRFASHVAATIFRLEFKRATRLVDWFRYRAFFDGARNEHRSVRVGYDGAGSESFDSIIGRIPDRRVFLKVDIEGWEYRILDQIAANAHRFTGLVMELHDVDLMRDRISRFLRQVDGNLLLCHIHANNCAGVDDCGDPLAIEVSLVSRALLKTGEGLEPAVLPCPVLDTPNDASRPEICLAFDGAAMLEPSP
jgi:hypothetical protein